MSRGYQLVLFSDATGGEASGYVFCADDHKARAAAEALLIKRPSLLVVHVYEGERLVWQIARDGQELRSIG